MTTSAALAAAPPADQPQGFVVRIVGAAAFAHLLNDLIQAVLPSIYPMLKSDFALSFAQIGWIALVYQVTASLLQPWVGMYTDKHPQPYLLPAGMLVTLAGIALLAFAGSYEMLLVAAAVVGVGSATFHPEASRVARMASGGRFGTAQSTFQVGGNTGSALGPLLTAAIVIPHGQPAIAWFMLAAALAVLVLLRVTGWSMRHGQARLKRFAGQQAPGLSRGAMWRAVVVVAVLMFAKFVYIASFTNYFTFYLIEHFGLSVQHSQLYLFVFLAAVALGTFAGGPVGDRIGRKAVIWVSFLGVAPFALALPHANLAWTAILAVAIGLVMSSAFAALVVYAQEAVPGRVGMVSGVMFGLMFGISGIGAAGLGELADRHGIEWVYQAIAFLPLLGLATALLPATRSKAPPSRCC
ncbi:MULTISPECIES: MFS transporter [Pseudomonas]|jgi:MFS transporter, FSR family, fosmidomycin resistance protein|uniref:Fosmidomycin resistance protein n=1 Tax=Pseudomonas putida TaxID=303 RepID=A0A1L7NAW5_PSEPU|nr:MULTISPECIES: MFS transporter [Pseudomonas]PNB61593.1 MFS transporter [Pseudomonas sp. FW305-130]MBP2084080.1 FSR family fosmidomycin resistance protein-like MFS transporter [Pseudomonas sp. PvP089]MBP2090218.1 FSR family fosmidomycin resistance protein-like MFS transporter [Pseudomonas sp. PvP088]MBP2223618.1 FSR family fosmidomycin resistance protein-like MFS transporter [Pseudomonas putida]PMY81167.1 MFS transporter [Pseudomonas sp. FW306-2-2C-D06B]